MRWTRACNGWTILHRALEHETKKVVWLHRYAKCLHRLAEKSGMHARITKIEMKKYIANECATLWHTNRMHGSNSNMLARPFCAPGETFVRESCAHAHSTRAHGARLAHALLGPDQYEIPIGLAGLGLGGTRETFEHIDNKLQSFMSFQLCPGRRSDRRATEIYLIGWIAITVNRYSSLSSNCAHTVNAQQWHSWLSLSKRIMCSCSTTFEGGLTSAYCMKTMHDIAYS